MIFTLLIALVLVLTRTLFGKRSRYPSIQQPRDFGPNIVEKYSKYKVSAPPTAFVIDAGVTDRIISLATRMGGTDSERALEVTEATIKWIGGNRFWDDANNWRGGVCWAAHSAFLEGMPFIPSLTQYLENGDLFRPKSCNFFWPQPN